MRVAKKARSRAVFSRRVGGIVVRGVALRECVEVRMLMGAVDMTLESRTKEFGFGVGSE